MQPAVPGAGVPATPGEFLRAVWPTSGIYCIATRFTIPDGPRKGEKAFTHKTFDNISDAVSYCLTKAPSIDLFFAVHTLKEHQVWDPNKINWKTGKAGSNVTRAQHNMRQSKAFFFDLDVGDESNKYQSQTDALLALISFCRTAQLPQPLVVNSGTGLHVYWVISEPIESNEWRNHEHKLKQLGLHYGLKIDTSRTVDTSSLLRVVGTLNFKDRHHPQPVKALGPVNELGTGLFLKLLDEAVVRGGVEVKPLPKFETGPFAPKRIEFQGTPVGLEPVITACAQMRRLAEKARHNEHISEPEWYYGVIGVGRFMKDGHRRIMQFATDPKWHDTIKEKIHQSEASQTGPTSCAMIAEKMGDALCVGCPFAGKVHGPIAAARWIEPAPAPEVKEFVGLEQHQVVIQIPSPPPPFIRKTDGTIGVHAEDEEGNKVYTMIFEHDLFPVRRLVNPLAATEQHVWRVTLPRGETKDFTLDAPMLYDTRSFTQAISNQGIYPHRGNVAGLQEYMTAYIKQLQQQVDADQQSNHLGWSDDFSRFILPDKIMCADGKILPAQLSIGAQRASVDVHKKGDAKKQAALINFYARPQYVAHQFLIMCGLGSTIFYATGNHGVIVNASGESGASKSTSLYTAASLWGNPALYPINGTNDGATIRGRNERVTVLANLPICVDEITHLPVKEANDLAMSITQPGHRIRLESSGVERAKTGSYKSTIMLATANNSLHALLSQDNAASTAASMRVFEIRFDITRVHTKAEADAFLYELKQNYGHLGEVFLAYVLRNRDAVVARVRAKMREIDEEAGIQASERFWSATIACALVACEIANELGICHYDVVYMRLWAVTVQIPAMRGIVKAEYADPVQILSDYLEQITPNMVVMEPVTGTQVGGSRLYAAKKPVGALLAHYDKSEQVMYVLKKGFKDHCARIGANSLRILTDLNGLRGEGRIVPTPLAKRTLGAGTEFAKGQSVCFVVNMAHPEIAGAASSLKVVEGGGETRAGQPPGLQLVQ